MFRAWYFHAKWFTRDLISTVDAEGLTMLGTLGTQATYIGNVRIEGTYEGVISVEPS